MRLYHYTCEHSMRGIRQAGTIRPNAHVLLPAMPPLIWLTDLDAPHKEALGLTGTYTQCDRTAHRLPVTAGADVLHWPDAARQWRCCIPRPVRGLLEAGGTLPMHWYVTTEPIDVSHALGASDIDRHHAHVDASR
jgi:hypothetical protein